MVHVAWNDHAAGENDQMYYKRSTNGGATWSGAKRLTWTSNETDDPCLAIDSNSHIHMVWSGDIFIGSEIYYRKSTDGGVAWSAPRRLTWTSGDSFSPAAAIDSGNIIHVVWTDRLPGNPEIYYRNGN